MTFEDLAPGACYRSGKSRKLRKKIDGERYVTVENGRVRRRKERGGAAVASAPCRIELLGLSGRNHPAEMIEISSARKRRP